jgi:branched-chain amino acid transport system permease protein
MNYMLHIITIISVYAVLGLSLNILVGYTGLLSVSQAAFYGIGAYTSAILTTRLGVNFFVAFLVAIIVAVLFSFLISLSSLRLRGDYFVLSTFAFQLILFETINNLTSLTGGASGVTGIPSPSILGHVLDNPAKYSIFSFSVAALCIIFLSALLNAPFGQVLKAIREDDIAAQALGKNVTKVKVKAFAISSGLAAVAGVLYAHYVTFIDPTTFTLKESIFSLSIVLIGGAGNIKGPLVGALVLMLLPEALRFLKIPDAIAPNIRQMIYGALLVTLMYFRPQGIAGEYKFE